MREVEILLDKEYYVPGDEINGKLRVITDKEFECNRIVVSLVGLVRASITTSGGKHSHTYRERRGIVADEIVLSGPTRLSPGETDYEFQFTLPPEALGTFHGYRADVEYHIHGVVEIPWALDPKETKEVLVAPTVKRLMPQRVVRTITLNDRTEIAIELPFDILTPERPLIARYTVWGDPKIRGLRFEIMRVIRRLVRGREREMPFVLFKGEVPRENLSYGASGEIQLEYDASEAFEFHTDILEVGYMLKVTADIPWRPDKLVMIPLRVGRFATEDPFFY